MTIKKRTKNLKAEIGVFGGSGFYDLLDGAHDVEIKTKYGSPSDKITLGTYKGIKVAFLPRHGKHHQYPPHKIPYKANIEAFKKLGVKKIIAPCAVGSLNPKMKPGDFVVCDQFINFTTGRHDTFFDGPRVAHISSADPYCSDLRDAAVSSCKRFKIKVHQKGTIIVINGPRFSTKAESRFFAKFGDIINMTAYPEVMLARERGMCYTNIALVTDYDVGVEGQKGIKPVSAKEVVKIFKENNEKVKKVIFNIIDSISRQSDCGCGRALDDAFIN